MQVVVKTPHTEITITGMISNSILKVLKQECGSDLKIIMERGIRPISLKMAQKLAILFNTTIDRFVISP